MKKYLTVLEKGMQLCKEKGYAHFKMEHCQFKSSDGRELIFKDIIHDLSGVPYEETTPTYTMTLYLYKDKPEDLSAVDAKKHHLLKKLAGKSAESSSIVIKEIESEEALMREIETSQTPVYIKCFSPKPTLRESCVWMLKFFSRRLKITESSSMRKLNHS